MDEEDVAIVLLTEVILGEYDDVRWLVVQHLHNILRAVHDSVDVERIPAEIVSFRLFRRYWKTSMLLYIDAESDRPLRRRIHDYCERHGIHARTKYRANPKGKTLSIRCDACAQYISDTECSGGEPYVRCHKCEDSDEECEVTYARYKPDDWDGPKNTRFKVKYISTGIMLILDIRASPTPSYKKKFLAAGESWRKRTPAF